MKIYLSKEQYKKLLADGSIKVGEITVLYNEEDYHITPTEDVEIDVSKFVVKGLDGEIELPGPAVQKSGNYAISEAYAALSYSPKLYCHQINVFGVSLSVTFEVITRSPFPYATLADLANALTSQSKQVFVFCAPNNEAQNSEEVVTWWLDYSGGTLINRATFDTYHDDENTFVNDIIKEI